jgi:hypothetical protein
MESARQIDSPSVGLAASDGEKTGPHGKRHRSRRRPCHPPVPGRADLASEGRIGAGLFANNRPYESQQVGDVGLPVEPLAQGLHPILGSRG